MIKINLSITFVLILSLNIYSQNNSVLASNYINGVFVQAGNIVKDNCFYSITVDGKNDSRIDLSKPKSLQEFSDRINLYKIYFPDYDIPNDKIIMELWKRIEKYNVTDSLYYWGGMPVIKLALGTAYLDTNAIPDIEIQYKSILYNQNNEQLSSALSNKIKFPGVAEFGKIKFLNSNFSNKKIYSEWVQKSPFANSFRVYREDNGSGKFNLLKIKLGYRFSKDSIHIAFVDTLVKMGSSYKYYLEPINLFEIAGANSDTAALRNFDKNSISVLSIDAKNIDSLNSIKISWGLLNGEIAKNIQIFRSMYFDSAFVKIADLPASYTSFLDENAEPMKKYYYAIKVSNILGEETGLSVKTFTYYKSFDKPLSPVLLSADGNTKGILLKWISPAKNVDGYYIYRNNDERPGFELISGLYKSTDSLVTFLDSSKSLSGKHFYSYTISCESSSHVKSDLSDTLSARPLFPTNPLTPSNLIIKENEKGISISWEDLNATDANIVAYNIYRKEANSKDDYKKINDLTLLYNHNYFVDSTITTGIQYLYCVSAIDIFGNESYKSSNVIAGLRESATTTPGIIKLYSEDNDILLQWDPILTDNISGYLVYRYERDVKPVLISEVQISDDPQYKDTNVQKGKLYFYFLTTKNSKGNESAEGPESSIRFGW